MRKNSVCIVLLMILFVTTGYTAEMNIRVTEGSVYPPFFIQNGKGGWEGLSIELVEALLKEAGYTPKYTPLPFARGLKYMKEGEIDMMLNMSITDERSNYINFIGPQLDETVVLVIKKGDNFKIESLDDLKKLPKEIGVDRGRVYGKAFEKKRATDKELKNCLDEVAEVDTNEKKLTAGRISVFLGFGYSVFYQIKTNPLYKDFTVHPFVVNQDWVYFGFSKKAVPPNQLQKFKEAFDRLEEKGVFESIKKKYVLYN